MCNKIRGLFLEYLDIFFLFISIMFSEMLLRHFCDLPLFHSQAFLFNITNYLILTGVLCLFKNKYRLIIEIVLSIIFAIYSFAQAVHYAFFTSFYSFRKLTVVNELLDVKDEIIAKLEWGHLLFIIPIIIMLLIYKYKKDKIYDKHQKMTIIIIIISIALGLVIKLSYVESIRSFYKIDNSWNKDYYLYRVMQNRYKYMNRFGIIEYNLKDIELTLTPAKSKIDDNEERVLDHFISNYNYMPKNDMSGYFKDKNLILILCESFDERGIDENLTPTLYKLRHEALYFNNHYAPIYQVATGDSEFISQTGMLPSIDYGTTSYKFNLNSYPFALANLFKDEGYDVNSYHSYDSNFYNRESIHESFGFSAFYDMDKLGLERWEGYKDTFNWIKDEDLFKAALDNTKTDEKFFDFIISVSGHMPYTPNRIELQENYDYIDSLEIYQRLDSETKSYLAAQMLLDQGVEVLIKGLKEKGILDDTVIMMFADHYPYGIKGDGAKDYILNNETSYPIYKVPMLIYANGLEARDINYPTSTFDIYPSIVNMFDLKADDAYKVGNDIFNEDDRLVIFENRSFLTKDLYYDSNIDKITKINKLLKDEELLSEYEKCSKKVNDIFYYGQEILISDYYGLKE